MEAEILRLTEKIEVHLDAYVSMREETVTQISKILEGRATVFLNGLNEIEISPLENDLGKVRLKHIKDSAWGTVDCRLSIMVKLIGWLFDTQDYNIGGDI